MHVNMRMMNIMQSDSPVMIYNKTPVMFLPSAMRPAHDISQLLRAHVSRTSQLYPSVYLLYSAQ